MLYHGHNFRLQTFGSQLNMLIMCVYCAKVKVHTFDIVPLHEIPPQKCSCMARVLKGFRSFTYTPTHSFPIRMCHTFAFPAIAGTNLPTLEAWKAELAWVAGYIVRQFTCPKAVTHPTTNRAQCKATTLIETNALPLH